jgi:hypothetical protein
MGLLSLGPREAIAGKVRKERRKILLTAVLLAAAAAELYSFGFPEWQSCLLLALIIPIAVVLAYYRK